MEDVKAFCPFAVNTYDAMSVDFMMCCLGVKRTKRGGMIMEMRPADN